jgi:hypothetical protein
MRGAEAPGGKRGSVPGPLLGKTTDPLASCEVEAMAELMTERLAELVSARLSDGAPDPSLRCGLSLRFACACALRRARERGLRAHQSRKGQAEEEFLRATSGSPHQTIVSSKRKAVWSHCLLRTYYCLSILIAAPT